MTNEERKQRATEFLLLCGSGQVDKVIPMSAPGAASTSRSIP